MKVTFNKNTALQIMRAVRYGVAYDCAPAIDTAAFAGARSSLKGSPPSGTGSPRILSPAILVDRNARVGLVDPDPAPQRRWSKCLFDLSRFGIDEKPSKSNRRDIAVSTPTRRLRSALVSNTVYDKGSNVPLPSFIDLGGGVFISAPELLFVEMAELLSPAEHLMLGYELCGRYARHPIDPRNGNAKLHMRPITSPENLSAYLETCKGLRGALKARKTLDLLDNEAWSPTESIVATVASLPLTEFGYGIGRCKLNERVIPEGQLAVAAAKESRVPDILFEDTMVGINYDGAVHLDLQAIANAGINMGQHPEALSSQLHLDRAIREVRAKAVDDIRRNRELAAAGYIVFPVVKEDLHDEGGLDKVMLQVMEAIETFAHKDMSEQKRFLESPFARERRQRLIWLLSPGSRETLISEDLGLRLADTEPALHEVLIGF